MWFHVDNHVAPGFTETRLSPASQQPPVSQKIVPSPQGVCAPNARGTVAEFAKIVVWFRTSPRFCQNEIDRLFVSPAAFRNDASVTCIR